MENETTWPFFLLSLMLSCYCYTKVDSVLAASQNGFCSYKLSLHKKINITPNKAKHCIFLSVSNPDLLIPDTAF
jgi:hypothetical protein